MVKKLPPKAHKTQILPIKPAVLRTFGATCPIVGNLASLTKTRQIVAEGLRREGSHIVEASGACAIVLSKREVAELALATLDKSPAASLKAFHTTLANIPKRPTLGLHLGKFYVIQHRDAPSNDEPVVIAELYRDKEGSAAPAFDARFASISTAYQLLDDVKLWNLPPSLAIGHPYVPLAHIRTGPVVPQERLWDMWYETRSFRGQLFALGELSIKYGGPLHTATA